MVTQLNMNLHDPPLVFDLDTDPGESTPIDPGPDVMASRDQLLHACAQSAIAAFEVVGFLAQSAEHETVRITANARVPLFFCRPVSSLRTRNSGQASSAR